MRSRAFQGLQNNPQKAFLWTPRTSTLFCGVGVGWALGAHVPEVVGPWGSWALLDWDGKVVWPAAKHQQLCQTRQDTGQTRVSKGRDTFHQKVRSQEREDYSYEEESF